MPEHSSDPPCGRSRSMASQSDWLTALTKLSDCLGRQESQNTECIPPKWSKMQSKAQGQSVLEGLVHIGRNRVWIVCLIGTAQGLPAPNLFQLFVLGPRWALQIVKIGGSGLHLCQEDIWVSHHLLSCFPVDPDSGTDISGLAAMLLSTQQPHPCAGSKTFCH